MSAAQLLRVPEKLKAVRARPPRFAEAPLQDGLPPIVDPNGSEESQLKEVWTAKVRTFDLSKKEDCDACEKVWQAVCDGLAVMSEHRTDFNAATGGYVSFLRWAALSYKV